MSQSLPRREREIMDILFQGSECSAHEVRERLPDPPSYSAVRALLAKLVDKGLVSHRAEGNRYLYSPTEDPARARTSALRHVVRTFFDDSPLKAANALLGLDEAGLEADEKERLKAMIEEMEQGGES